MKTININSSYPGFADDFITYEGSLNTVRSGYLAYGVSGSAYSEFTITTEIINNLVATFRCVASSGQLRDNDTTRSNVFSDVLKSFELPYKLAKVGDRTNVIVRVPHGCICNYSITGQKCLGSDLEENEEVVETQAFFTEGFSAFGHSHDGVDGNYIKAGELSPNPGQAGKFLRVSSDGTKIIYSDASTGTLGLFNLTTPANRTEFNLENPLITFTWEASTDATSYRLIVVKNETNTIVLNQAGLTGLTYTIATNFLLSRFQYSWYVIATDGTYFLSSPVNVFITSQISFEYYVLEGNTLSDSGDNESIFSSSYLATKAMREVLKTGDNYKYYQAVPTSTKIYYFDVRRMTAVATSSTNTIVVPLNSGNLSITTLTTQMATDLKNDINSCRASAIFDPSTCDASVTTYAGLVSAISAATAGQTIRITSSFTATNHIILKDGVNLYINDGVTITSNFNGRTFRDNEVACVCSVMGFGTFIHSDTTNITSNLFLNIEHQSSNVWFEFRQVTFNATFAAFYISHLGDTGGGTLRVKGKTVISAARLYDSDVQNSLWSLDILTVNTGHEIMYPESAFDPFRIYLKNMYIQTLNIGDIAQNGVSMSVNFIGIFIKASGTGLNVAVGQINLFYCYFELPQYFINTGGLDVFVNGYNMISNKPVSPALQSTATNFTVEPSFTLTDLT